MTRVLTLILTALIVAACGANKPVTSNDSATVVLSNPVKAVTIQSIIPYQKGAPIAANIKAECALDQKLSEYIQSSGNDYNVAITRTPGANKDTKGNVLLVEIVGAVSQGNAFIGHQKFTKVAGTLYDNGKKVASFTASRLSGGGFWGVYKGSCSVLGRTVVTLGKDIAGWLAGPVDGIQLGDGI